MAVVGDNRGGTNRPVAPSPDGSWSFEDARRRREQRQAEETAPASPATGEPEEDLAALALSLADNLTVDGTPLSQLDIHQARDGGDALGLPSGHAATAEEIMRALETEQHGAAATSDNGPRRHAHDPRSTRSPHRPGTRQGPHHRWLYPPRRWVIACAVVTAVLVVLAIQLASGTGPNPQGHSNRPVAAGTTAATTGLINAAMNRFLAAEHAADRALSPKRPRTTRSPRPGSHHPRPAPARISTSPAGSPSPGTGTSSTGGTSEAVDTTQQGSPPTFSPPSTSTSSGSGQGAPATQPHTSPSSNSGSSSASPSKATLRSLVTGAGTCGCQ
jgi:hypothetical protein